MTGGKQPWEIAAGKTQDALWQRTLGEGAAKPQKSLKLRATEFIDKYGPVFEKYTNELLAKAKSSSPAKSLRDRSFTITGVLYGVKSFPDMLFQDDRANILSNMLQDSQMTSTCFYISSLAKDLAAARTTLDALAKEAAQAQTIKK